MSADVTLQADSEDIPLANFRVATFETGMAMASARAAAEFGAAIGVLSKTNDAGRHETLVHTHGHALVVEDTWEPAQGEGDFQCESCGRNCEEQSCCDNCEECCHCEQWYCEGCDEYQSDDEASCENCNECDSCCECHHCEGCNGTGDEDEVCGTCDQCTDCCSCCHCHNCGDTLPEDHGSYEDACYCTDCMPDDEDEDED